MILICDGCGRFYERDAEGHYYGEPNLCCEACAWKVSNDGEPQPEHTCDKRFDKDVKSLFLFLETCLVDGMGRVKTVHMNAEDMTIAKKLAKDGYIEFGRIKFRAVEKLRDLYPRYPPTCWVRFSDKAWAITHYLRRKRSDRMIARNPKYDEERAIN